jgi:hypothetical protein
MAYDWDGKRTRRLKRMQSIAIGTVVLLGSTFYWRRVLTPRCVEDRQLGSEGLPRLGDELQVVLDL